MKSSDSRAAASRAPFGVLSTGLPAMVNSAAPSRSLDLLREAGGGQLAVDLREPADAARAAAEADALAAAGLTARVGRARRGFREHRPAGTIQAPGEDVEHVDEPARDRPELLLAGSHAPVHGGSRRGGEVPRQAADDRRVDATCRRHGLRREVARQSLDVVDADEVLRQSSQPDESLRAQDVDEGEQQERIGAGRMMMLVGLGRGARAAGIDDDAPAARADATQARLHVGRRHEAAVRHHGSAPRMRRKAVRSRSGTGTVRAVPNMSPALTCFGIWSTVLAENTLRVPSARSSARG